MEKITVKWDQRELLLNEIGEIARLAMDEGIAEAARDRYAGDPEKFAKWSGIAKSKHEARHNAHNRIRQMLEVEM